MPTSAVPPSPRLAAGTGGSVLVERCQVCGSDELDPVLFVGFLPPVNTMSPIGARPVEQPAYPAQILRCGRCSLVQLGLVVDPQLLFPPDYAYTSGTTRILRENFADLYREVATLITIGPDELIVDIGSNDGTLLSNFQRRHRVLGVEPTNAGHLAIERGIPTLTLFFDHSAAQLALREAGPAKVITATNVFAHIENVHAIVEAVLELMGPASVFITESHYWLGLVESLQYDTIYHEHLRHYTVGSLAYLLAMHGLEVFHARRIPTHGGSIRVYAARRGDHPVRPSVRDLIDDEERRLDSAALERFRRGVVSSKLGLHALLKEIRDRGDRVYGVGAPSRATTLVNYVGLDDGIVDCIVEVEGSHKVGKYIPGTLIPILAEPKLFDDQPEHALLLSWHIGDELMTKFTARGFRGDYIVPLPEPHLERAR